MKLELPAAVGVPLRAPVDALRARPAGRFPVETDHAYGGMPPVPASVVAYAMPIVPAGSGPGAVVIFGLIGIFNAVAAVRVLLATEAAVTVAVNAVATFVGAV